MQNQTIFRKAQRVALDYAAGPCWMGSYAICETGIARVVIGAATPDVGGISPQYPVFPDDTIKAWSAPPEIMSGVLAEQCRYLQQL